MYKIGIINCKTGKHIKYYEVGENQVMPQVEKCMEWIDKQDTFFSGKEYKNTLDGQVFLQKIKNIMEGKTIKNLAVVSIAIFNGNKGTEHEFYVEKMEK